MIIWKTLILLEKILKKILEKIKKTKQELSRESVKVLEKMGNYEVHKYSVQKIDSVEKNKAKTALRIINKVVQGDKFQQQDKKLNKKYFC